MQKKPIVCVLAGANQVGKTKLLNMHIEEENEDYEEETIKEVVPQTEGSINQNVHYVDVGGSKRTRETHLPVVLADADGIIMVYKDMATLQVLNEIYAEMQKQNKEHIRGIIVKADEMPVARDEAFSQGEDVARKWGMRFSNVVLKDRSTVESAFSFLLEGLALKPAPKPTPKPAPRLAPKLRERKTMPTSSSGHESLMREITRMQQQFEETQARMSLLEASLHAEQTARQKLESEIQRQVDMRVALALADMQSQVDQKIQQTVAVMVQPPEFLQDSVFKQELKALRIKIAKEKQSRKRAVAVLERDLTAAMARFSPQPRMS